MTLRATAITEALADRLRLCTAGAGCPSNVGATVQVGRLRAGAVEAPCCYVLPARVVDTPVYGSTQHARTYELQAFVDANQYPALSEWDLIDQMTHDIRRTVELGGPLPGVDAVRFIAAEPGYRQDGGTAVGVYVEYELTFYIHLSDP